jgi:hypothetical protein
MYYIVYVFSAIAFVKYYDDNQECSSPVLLSVESGELVLKTDKTTESIPRDRIKRYVIKNGLCLLFRGSMHFHIVPSNVLDENRYFHSWLNKGVIGS